MEIKEKSSTVSIDVSKCLSCETKACVAACKKYARGILELKDGVPSVEHLTAEEVLRLGTECLACEFACTFHGNHHGCPCRRAAGISGQARIGLTPRVGSGNHL